MVELHCAPGKGFKYSRGDVTHEGTQVRHLNCFVMGRAATRHSQSGPHSSAVSHVSHNTHNNGPKHVDMMPLFPEVPAAQGMDTTCVSTISITPKKRNARQLFVASSRSRAKIKKLFMYPASPKMPTGTPCVSLLVPSPAYFVPHWLPSPHGCLNEPFVPTPQCAKGYH